MSSISTYNYNKQLRAYMVQFCAIFAGLEVEVGKSDDTEARLIKVPIASMSKDRVVASIKSGQTQNKPIRLPLFSAFLSNIALSPELRKGVGVTRRNSYLPTGGLIPDDIKVVKQRQPVPYRATYELAVWASNQDQHYQIMEQILSLFDPMLQIQTSDDVFDLTRITTVELTDVRFDENIPAATDRRMIQSTMSFTVPIYLSVPAEVHNQFIEDIYLRIGAVSTDVDTAMEALEDLDGQGLEYTQIFDGSSVLDNE